MKLRNGNCLKNKMFIEKSTAKNGKLSCTHLTTSLSPNFDHNTKFLIILLNF